LTEDLIEREQREEIARRSLLFRMLYRVRAFRVALSFASVALSLVTVSVAVGIGSRPPSSVAILHKLELTALVAVVVWVVCLGLSLLERWSFSRHRKADNIVKQGSAD